MRILIIIGALALLVPSIGQAKKFKAAGSKDISLLKSVEGKYQKGQGIIAELKRTVSLKALGTSREAVGKVHINNGKMHLAMRGSVKEKVIVDGQWIWMFSPSPKEFKNAKPQVFKASMKSKQARSQGLLKILTKGQILKHFSVSSVEDLSKSRKGFWLQPGKSSREFTSARIIVSDRSKQITELSFWDNRGNQTTYKFLKTKFRQKIGKEKFIFTPPPNAEIISGNDNV